MSAYLLVFVGGGLGSVLRYGVSRVSLHYLGSGFPYGTMFVNVIGGLLMGSLAQLFLAKAGAVPDVRLFLATGVLGGFTTFSAFSLEAAMLFQRGAYPPLFAYVVGSVLLSIGAVVTGIAVVRALTA